MKRIEDIVIAGAGIGGLTAALALAQKGFNVTVCEQSAYLGEVGAGLQMSPNAMAVLKALGMKGALLPYASVPEHASIRHFQTGEYYLKQPLAETFEARYGAPYWHLHRADLHCELALACEQHGVQLLLNAAVRGYKENINEHQVTLLLEDGRHFGADLLIGADGIRSRIREQIFGKESPDFTGQVAWRGIVPADRVKHIGIRPDACVWVGPDRHFVSYFLRGGTFVNFVAVEERSNWRSESWSEKGDVRQLRERFLGWHPEVSGLLDAVENTFLWALYGRPEFPFWYKNRVVLLGDACHPMLPFMAQGAAMAIEDAYVLAHSLANFEVENALVRYEKRRKSRATHIQKMSRDNAGLYHMKNGLLGKAKLKALKMASLYSPSIVHSKLDYVYGCDVTQNN